MSVKVGGKDDVNSKDRGEEAIVWESNASGRFASPVKYKDLIFHISSNVIVAFNAETGEKVNQARIPGASAARGGGGGRGGGRPGGGEGGRGGRGPGGEGRGGRDGGDQEELIPTSLQQERGGRGGFGGGQRGGQRGGRGGFGGGSRFGNIDYASPVVAGGKLYVTLAKGQIHVFNADKDLELVKSNDLSADTAGFAASPAISDGHLYIRSHSTLYCFGE